MNTIQSLKPTPQTDLKSKKKKINFGAIPMGKPNNGIPYQSVLDAKE